MPPINVLMKPASGSCNMHCDYCFYCDESIKRSQECYGMMSNETLKNVIRKTILRAEGYISYAYQGGEPTLRGIDFFKKAVAYQNQYNKNNVQIQNALQTNGYEINEEWCQFFHDNHFLVGVSIDGNQETHDRYRHNHEMKGTYDRVVESTRLLDKYKVDYNILTVVNQTTAVRIKDIYTDYKEQGWKYQQYIACLDPIGEEHGKNAYALLPEQYGRFLIELFHMWYEDWKKGEAPYIRQFDNYIGILQGFVPESCEQRGICGIQNVVEADGSVYPCDFYMLDQYCLGNFNTNQLNEIDEKRIGIGFVNRSKKISEECKTCNYYSLCRGGCQRNKDYREKENTYHNYFCKGYKMFFEQCIEQMRTIKL